MENIATWNISKNFTYHVLENMLLFTRRKFLISPFPLEIFSYANAKSRLTKKVFVSINQGLEEN